MIMKHKYLPKPKYLNYQEREKFLENFLKDAPIIMSIGCGVDDLYSINNLFDINKLHDRRDDCDNFEVI